MNIISSDMRQTLYLLLLIILLTGCRQSDSPSSLEFTGYANNPILTPGEPGSWDDLNVAAPQIVFHENTFYLFYMGCNVAGRMAIGLATSTDGFNYSKFEGNPLLAPDSSGFDAFTLGPGILLKEDTTWVMYYNCQEIAVYAPGTSVGRATARQLTGPWIRGSSPVLTSGKKGEWDDGFIIPSSVLKLDDGSFRMYYSGGREISTYTNFYIGMHTCPNNLSFSIV
ncbi:MAG: hypothetical protein Q8M08_14060 [Bacteroidales bacterium]|nr:hypothetical protein [Bacteroidales bacterium]